MFCFIVRCFLVAEFRLLPCHSAELHLGGKVAGASCSASFFQPKTLLLRPVLEVRTSRPNSRTDIAHTFASRGLTSGSRRHLRLGNPAPYPIVQVAVSRNSASKILPEW